MTDDSFLTVERARREALDVAAADDLALRGADDVDAPGPQWRMLTEMQLAVVRATLRRRLAAGAQDDIIAGHLADALAVLEGFGSHPVGQTTSGTPGCIVVEAGALEALADVLVSPVTAEEIADDDAIARAAESLGAGR